MVYRCTDGKIIDCNGEEVNNLLEERMDKEQLPARNEDLVNPPVQQEGENFSPNESEIDEYNPVGKAVVAETSADYRNSIIRTQLSVIYRYWKQVFIKPDNKYRANKNKPRLTQIYFSGYKRFLPSEGKQNDRQVLVPMVTLLMKDKWKRIQKTDFIHTVMSKDMCKKFIKGTFDGPDSTKSTKYMPPASCNEFRIYWKMDLEWCQPPRNYLSMSLVSS